MKLNKKILNKNVLFLCIILLTDDKTDIVHIYHSRQGVVEWVSHLNVCVCRCDEWPPLPFDAERATYTKIYQALASAFGSFCGTHKTFQQTASLYVHLIRIIQKSPKRDWHVSAAFLKASAPADWLLFWVEKCCCRARCGCGSVTIALLGNAQWQRPWWITTHQRPPALASPYYK